jgi:hypothetical protein
MNYKWIRNNYPPTIYDGECIETNEKIGGVTCCITVDGIAFYTYIGIFYDLHSAKESLIKNYENYEKDRKVIKKIA